MTQILKSRNLSFEAEVVEVFERDGRRVAKVLVHSFFIEIDATDLSGVHLGDTILFNGSADSSPAPPTANNRPRAR